MAAQQPARTSPELRARLHSARANVGITPRPGALPRPPLRPRLLAAARPARVFSFAPRIKNIGKQRLYVFRGHNRRDRGSWKVTPDNYINDALVRGNWDDLLRLVTTIKLKENTASDIFRRLNSYSRQHALYQTLKAFGQIIKSIFILRYIDDLELRQAIEKQLNRIELANRFTRAVAVGNPREFTQAEKEEQEIAEACNRLIKNSIICWNYLYLARQFEKAPDAETRKNILRLIATHMLGEYDFFRGKIARRTWNPPPEISRMKLRQIREAQKRKNKNNISQMRERLCRLTYLYADGPSILRHRRCQWFWGLVEALE